jgi:ribosomal protein S10
MKTFCLFISTKNLHSLKKFLTFIQKHLFTVNSFVNKSFAIKKKKRIITLLKSPHVNKSAQEQFEIKTYLVQIDISSIDYNSFIILIKKTNNTLFPDVRLKVKYICNNKTSIIKFKKVLNERLDVFRINNSATFLKFKQLVLLKKLDCKDYKKTQTLFKLIEFNGKI